MPEIEREEVTRLLKAARAGDQGANEALWPLVYEKLRHLAHKRMAGERAGHTLQVTVLVHEAYLRLLGDSTSWPDRRHFYSAAAQAMPETPDPAHNSCPAGRGLS